MDIDQIYTGTLHRVIDFAKGKLGVQAVKVANKVEGLHVRSNGDITIKGDQGRLLKELLEGLENELDGKLTLDLSTTKICLLNNLKK